MLTSIADTTIQLWQSTRKTKRSPSGWISGNAPCCTFNGESQDTKSRGGLITDGSGKVSYSCFNCNFRAGFIPGNPLSIKFKKLLKWFGANSNEIQRLTIDALRIKDLVGVLPHTAEIKEEISITPRSLPEGSASFKEWTTLLNLGDDSTVIPQNVVEAVAYVDKRCEPNAGPHSMIHRYEFFTTDQTSQNLHKRVIIPCYWKGNIIGYTARTWDSNVKPKYLAHYDGNYVFNIDKQKDNSKFVIVVEGPFDAMAIDGVAIMRNECNDNQAEIIESLGKEVIVVPDFDISNGKWPGRILIDQAIEFGWSVSFPIWNELGGCKDVSDAVQKYGKLFTMQSILSGKEKSKLKIELKKKTYVR